MWYDNDMERKFKFVLSKKVNIAYWISVALLIVGLCVDIALLIMTMLSDSPYITPYITSLVLIAVILPVMLAIKFGCYYLISKDKFVFYYAFIPKKIDYSDIFLIRHSEKENLTLLYYKAYTKSGDEEVRFFSVCITSEQVNDFYKAVKEHSDTVIYEDFDSEYKENIE